MKILLVCDQDNGSQLFNLYKALNKYTNHSARLITFKSSFLEYQTDIFNPSPYVVNELISWADFFILGEMLTPNIQSMAILKNLTPFNCIIRANGSLSRAASVLYKSPIMKTGGHHDITLAIQENLFPMASTVNMYFFDEWAKEVKNNHPYKLVYSGTKRKKQSREHSGNLFAAWDVLKNMYGSDMIEFIDYSDKSFKESLQIKSQCHITYDQFGLGTYGSSSIEGMYYHMPTFCFISGWTQCVHPDVPLINCFTPKDIVSKTIELINDPDKMQQIGDAGHDYVMRVHSAEVAVERWKALIKYVSEEYRR